MALHDVGDFKLLKSHKVDATPMIVGKWRSQKTGMSVVWTDSPGERFCFPPLVRLRGARLG